MVNRHNGNYPEMKHVLRLFCIGIFLHLPLWSYSSEPKEILLNNIIAINLVTPGDPYFPCLRAGYYHGFTENWYAGVEFGYGNYDLFNRRSRDNYITLNEEYKVWEMRLEVQYILQTRHRIKPYISSEIFYIHHSEILTTGAFCASGSKGYITYSEVDYLREKCGLNIKLGMLIMMTDQVALGPYFGGGFRGKMNTYSNLHAQSFESEPSIPYFIDELPETWYVRKYAVEGYNINVTAGIKINFLF
jgi:hypothetical protein